MQENRRTKRGTATSGPCGAFGGCALTLAKTMKKEINEYLDPARKALVEQRFQVSGFGFQAEEFETLA